VWPAVLREENGAVLHKGLVQAISPRPWWPTDGKM
jgi:hypothetical protein